MSSPDPVAERHDRIPRARGAPATWRRWTLWLAPYLIAAGVIAFLSRQYSIDAVRAEMARGNVLPLGPIALVTYVASLLWVAAADRVVLVGSLGADAAPRYASIAKGKAAAVVLHIVHYALGQGAYATWLGRRTGIGVGRTGGLIFYIVAAELSSVCVFATLVIVLGQPNVPTSLLLTVAGVAAGLVGFALVAPLTRLERLTAFETWTKLGARRGLTQLGIRLLQHTTTTTGSWLAATAFGLEIPFSVMLSYMPVILVVGSLPVNVAGFGAVQAAWLMLSGWAPAERILAFSVVWQAVSALALLVRGLPFLPGMLADVKAGSVGRTTETTAGP